MNNLSVGWFDLIAVAMVGVGVVVGRRRGMSSEMLDAIQWLLIVFLSALAYDPFGRILAEATGLGAFYSFLLAYLLVAAAVFLIFLVVKRMAGEKLLSSDTFGGFEYYLGMFAGVVRFACILLFALALLNAKQVSDQELATQIKAQDESLGAIYFPPFGMIQRAVFQRSFTGVLVKEYLSAQLINVDPTAGGKVTHEGIGRRREREVDEVVSPTRK
jgi:uncharacterized membrane protein required for colicin V production